MYYVLGQQKSFAIDIGSTTRTVQVFTLLKIPSTTGQWSLPLEDQPASEATGIYRTCAVIRLILSKA